MKTENEKKQWTFDPERYEGHTPGPWVAEINGTICTQHKQEIAMLPGRTINTRLIADAPHLLEECKRLKAKLDNVVDSVVSIGKRLGSDKLLKELERLRELEDRLPKTADGVPVVPGDVLWGQDADGGVVSIASGKGLMMLDDAESFDEPGYPMPEDSYYGKPSFCYSTKEAAEAARKGTND